MTDTDSRSRGAFFVRTRVLPTTAHDPEKWSSGYQKRSCAPRHARKAQPVRSSSDARPPVVAAFIRSLPVNKIRRRNADRRVTCRPHQRMRSRAEAQRARLSAFHRGACGSEPTPPLSSRTRFLGRGLLQALPEAHLSQSSDQVAGRSSCRPGVFPKPPGSGGDEPPPAGTALAPSSRRHRLPSLR
jgi:hypothetical protein